MKISRFPDYKPRADDNLASAKKCADRIVKYYAAQGITVRAWVDTESMKISRARTQRVYTVKTAGIPGVK